MASNLSDLILTNEQILDAALDNRIEPASLAAIAEIESKGCGFIQSGDKLLPKILFEAHIFGRLTQHKYSDTNPDISARRWDRSLYKGGLREWDRLKMAESLDANAALQSASWGKFQIMGFNYSYCGYSSVEDFVSDMHASEVKHLKAVIAFMTNKGLIEFLRRGDTHSFFTGYNGSAYKVNRYDTKYYEAYRRFKPIYANLLEGSDAVAHESYKKIVVQSGDTLSGIADKYANGNLDAILRLNPDIQNPNVIAVGAVVKIP